jgi:DNA polymerase-3 subunit chi
MTQVDFYILKESEEQDRLVFACRLTEKAMNQGLKIHIHTSDEQTAQDMDDLLWSFRPDSFIPHAIVGIDEELTEDEDIPVFIGFGEQVQAQSIDLLINLGTEIPAGHEGFSRIAEIVRNAEEPKARLREHWNSYKAKGFELKHHQL